MYHFGDYQTYHLTIHRRTLVLSSSLSSYCQKDQIKFDLGGNKFKTHRYDEIGTVPSE